MQFGQASPFASFKSGVITLKPLNDSRLAGTYDLIFILKSVFDQAQQ